MLAPSPSSLFLPFSPLSPFLFAPPPSSPLPLSLLFASFPLPSSSSPLLFSFSSLFPLHSTFSFLLLILLPLPPPTQDIGDWTQVLAHALSPLSCMIYSTSPQGSLLLPLDKNSKSSLQYCCPSRPSPTLLCNGQNRVTSQSCLPSSCPLNTNPWSLIFSTSFLILRKSYKKWHQWETLSAHWISQSS